MGDRAVPGEQAEEGPPQQERQAGDDEQGDRREVAQDVLLVKAVPVAAEEVAREGEEDARDAHGGDLVAVARRDVDVVRPDPEDVQVDEHVVLEEVAPRQVVEIDLFEEDGGDGEVAVLRIEDVPVARGELGEEGEGEVADQAVGGHLLQRVAGEEAVALGVVAGGRHQGVEEGGKVGGVHLAVAVHLHHDPLVRLQHRPKAGDHRPAHPLVLGVGEAVEAGVGDLAQPLGGGVGARVVHHPDRVHPRRKGGHHRGDVGGDVVRRDHDVDGDLVVHR